MSKPWKAAREPHDREHKPVLKQPPGQELKPRPVPTVAPVEYQPLTLTSERIPVSLIPAALTIETHKSQ